GKSDFASILGPDGSVFFTPGTDTKKVEDKMAEALIRLDSWKKARAEEKSELPADNIGQPKLTRIPAVNSTPIDSNPGNSTLDNISIIGPLSNSSHLNSSKDQDADAIKFDANSSAGLQNVGSSTKGSFDGYYGITASRHEMSKSSVDSRMFLSGTFEMDKTVKFQDRGI
ncbi:MAG: hypothetical protein M0Q43_08810, partial [Methanothrix sp.]|nr:hypothetical protein [Methanothrix sp.]